LATAHPAHASGAATTTHPLTAIRDHVPRLGLLVGGQNGDRIALIRAHLFFGTLHVSLHALTELTPSRGVPGLTSKPSLSGIHGGAQRAATRLGPARDGSQPHDLGVGQLELSRLRQKHLRRRRASLWTTWHGSLSHG